MAPSPSLYTTHFLVTNIHCPSCVSYVQDVLRLLPQIQHVDVSIIDHVVRVQHKFEETETITKALLDAAFEVQHITTRDKTGRQIRDETFPLDTLVTKSRSIWPKPMSRAQRKHIANCEACQSQLARTSPTTRLYRAFKRRKTDSDRWPTPSLLEKGDGSKQTSLSTSHNTQISRDVDHTYAVELSISGMTCSSCVSAITTELRSKEFVKSVDINLLTNSGRVTFIGKESDAQKLVEDIDDIGYEASIISITPVKDDDDDKQDGHKQTQVSRAYFSIEGMTCGSCVGTITRGLKDVPGMQSVNVDLVGASAIIEFQEPLDIETIIEKIDDLGYDASLVKVDESPKSSKPVQKQERNIRFDISGMYCPRCPLNILQALDKEFGSTIAILSEPTLQDSTISLQYIPRATVLTARRLRDVIETADPAIRASVYHPPSIEERSRRLQRKERNRILRHLLLTFLVAVPSFVIGVVYMSLVPESNSTRQWFEESIWSGTVMRMEWALFIMTTPAFFYGASVFHSRALLEIWSLWRPGSKVPLFRRFYRFGSMNLLISAGTSVAYFSSLAVLIMDATSTPESSPDGLEHRHSTTYFDTVTFLTFFILIGRFLEAYSKAKTGDAVAMLGNLRPVDALLLETEPNVESDLAKKGISTQMVPVDLLEIGDRVSVPHGASPPVDGEIDQDGEFVFDESSLTGESKPVRKVRGDKVLTGSVNVSHPVTMMVQATGSQSMLDQIINVVREGQAKRAPVERLADIITGYFTPVITAIAIITWIIWLALGGSGTLPHRWLDVDHGGWPFWSVEFAIAVFVVACPCGIGLAAPTALFVGGGLAAKAGILVQGGGQAFQEASRLDSIVFDKTGTLTEGKMKVADLQVMVNEKDSDQKSLILKLARALETSSTHPIAQAVAKYCQESIIGDIEIQNAEVKEIPGRGMTGTFRVQRHASEEITTFEAAIGNETLLEAFEPSTSKPHSDEIESITKQKAPVVEENDFLNQSIGTFQSKGMSTPIFYMRQVLESGADNIWRPAALFAVADPIRSEAPPVLQELREQGIAVHMCTGDNPTTAHAIASQLQIPVAQVRAGVLPQSKATYINELQHDADGKRRVVAFVGDGTNDTPALSAADVSIALSTGSDVAITAASFILLNSELTTILKLTKLAKRVFGRVKLNFLWAAVYNICLVPVAAGVFFPIGQWRLNPVWASLAMALSSVSVVLSSLALRLPEIDFKKGLRKHFRKS